MCKEERVTMEENKCIKRLDQPNLNRVAELMKGIGELEHI